MSLVVVCGLKAEAAIAQGPGVRCIVGGGRADLLRARLEAALEAARPDGVLSFGVAGALASDLRTGELRVASSVAYAGVTYETDPPWREALVRRLKAEEAGMAAVDSVVADRGSKSRLHAETGAHLVDMESGVAAEVSRACGLPFLSLRAVADTAAAALPPSAVAGMGEEGEVRVGAVLKSLATRPGDLPALVRMGRASGVAFEALRRARETLGPEFAFAR